MGIVYWKNLSTGYIGHGKAVKLEHAEWVVNNTYIKGFIHWVEKL